MSNFLHKKIWSDQDWDTFYNNISILLNKHRLKKREFSAIVGVKNFFRTDRKKVSRRVIDKICKKFDVNEKWLNTEYPTIDQSNHEIFDGELNLNQRVEIPKMSQAFTLLSIIYESGNDHIIRAVFDVISALADLANDERKK